MSARSDPKFVVNPWSFRKYRFGCAGMVSAALHLGGGLLLMGVLVRTPDVMPPIRVFLYDPAPPPPASTGGADAVPAPVPAVVQPEPQRVAPNTKPKRAAAPRIRRRHVPKEADVPPPPESDAMASAAAPAGSTGGVPGGVPGGLTGGTVGGTGTTLLSADQAMYRPEPIAKVLPKYPPVARLRGIEGQVVLEAILAADGHVEPNITVVHSVPLLDEASIAAFRQWRFRPARAADGVPIRVSLRVPFRFVLR
jgi:protein TonB